jgi:hypothetical protein
MKKLWLLPLLCLLVCSATAVSEAAVKSQRLYARAPHVRAFVVAPATAVGVRVAVPAPITIQSPELVVIPSGNTYVYMMPNMAGVYFHGGYWYRYHGNRWFRATVYNGSWAMIKVAPAAVVAVDPLYTYYLPAAYYRINITIFQEKWSEWEQTRTWDTHEWFVNEAKSEVRTARVNSIKADRSKGIDRSKVKVEVAQEAPVTVETAVAPASVSVEVNVVAPAQLEIQEPDMVVVPSGDTYIYMIPTIVGVYFYDGYWYRYHEGAWFSASVYNGAWVGIAAAPAVVVAIDPYYPFYLPAGYHKIGYADFHAHWQNWNHNHHWHNQAWFKHEMKHDIRDSRLSSIKADKAKGIDPLKKSLQAKKESPKDDKVSKDVKTKKVKKSVKKDKSGKSEKSVKNNKTKKNDQTAKSGKSVKNNKVKKSAKSGGKNKSDKIAKSNKKMNADADVKTTKADHTPKNEQMKKADQSAKSDKSIKHEQPAKNNTAEKSGNSDKAANHVKSEKNANVDKAVNHNKSEKNVNADKSVKKDQIGKEDLKARTGQTLKNSQTAKKTQTLQQNRTAGKIQANKNLQGSRNTNMQRKSQAQPRQHAPQKASGFDRR